MTIQESLRREAGLVGDSDFLASMLRHAADRIDTLTAENAALSRTNDTLHKDWSEVNAENERLRAALRKIDQCWQESGAGCCDCAHVARTALSQHTQSGGENG